MFKTSFWQGVGLTPDLIQAVGFKNIYPKLPDYQKVIA